jgi:hypothetical protein
VDGDLSAFDDLHGEFAAIQHRHSKEGLGFNGVDRDDTGLAVPQSDRFVDPEGAAGSIREHPLPPTFPDQTQPGYLGQGKSEGARETGVDNGLDLEGAI